MLSQNHVDRPKVADDADIHYLDADEVEALLNAMPDDDFGSVQRVLTWPPS